MLGSKQGLHAPRARDGVPTLESLPCIVILHEVTTLRDIRLLLRSPQQVGRHPVHFAGTPPIQLRCRPCLSGTRSFFPSRCLIYERRYAFRSANPVASCGTVDHRPPPLEIRRTARQRMIFNRSISISRRGIGYSLRRSDADHSSSRGHPELQLSGPSLCASCHTIRPCTSSPALTAMRRRTLGDPPLATPPVGRWV